MMDEDMREEDISIDSQRRLYCPVQTLKTVPKLFSLLITDKTMQNNYYTQERL